MGVITTNDFRTGLTVVFDHNLWSVVEYQHVKPGKGGAFVRTKFRKLKDGSVVEHTFRVGEKFEEAYIEEHKLQFQYRAGTTHHFMNTETYEDVQIEEDVIGPQAGFLKENMEISGKFHDGKLIGLELPVFVELLIQETEPGIKGDSSKSSGKPAKLETGKTITVPLFVGPGELVRIDTRTGAYVSRA